MAFDVRKPPVSFQVYGPAGPNHSPGLVPDPGSVSGLGQVLTDQGWSIAPGGLYSSGTVPTSSPVTLSSGTVSTLVALPLAAGTWDAWANFGYSVGASVTAFHFRAWINTVAADPGPGPNNGAYYHYDSSAALSPLNVITFVGRTRLTLAAPGTVYLGAFSIYTGLPPITAFGFLGAESA